MDFWSDYKHTFCHGYQSCQFDTQIWPTIFSVRCMINFYPDSSYQNTNLFFLVLLVVTNFQQYKFSNCFSDWIILGTHSIQQRSGIVLALIICTLHLLQVCSAHLLFVILCPSCGWSTTNSDLCMHGTEGHSSTGSVSC